MSRPLILVTGATGHVGSALIEALDQRGAHYRAGKRKVTAESDVYLDLKDASSFAPALEDVDALFLMRPPALTDAKGIFRPFLE